MKNGDIAQFYNFTFKQEKNLIDFVFFYTAICTN